MRLKINFIMITIMFLCAIPVLTVFVLNRQSVSCDLLHGRLIETAKYVAPCYQAAIAASRYYENIQAQKYSDAFSYVGYYTDYSDVSPTIPYDVARTVWVERVVDLVEKHTSILKVNHITVYIDDGYPKGTADLQIVEDGTEKEVVQNIDFIHRGSWKVQTVRSSSDVMKMDEAISGDVQIP